MQFTLVINLDNAEVEDNGIDQVLPHYLGKVAERCATGSADAGNVLDGNGNTIGRYFTNDASLSERFAAELGATLAGNSRERLFHTVSGPAELAAHLAKMAGEVR